MWLLALTALRYDVQKIFKWSVSKAPSTGIRFLFENGDFFSGSWPTVHTYQVKTVTKNVSFRAVHSEDFWKCWLLVYDWTDENGGFRIRWCHSSLTTIITHVLWGMLSYFYCLPFPYGRAKKIRISYVWMLFFSEKGGKNLRFQKYLDTCGRGLRVASLCISFHGQYPIVVKQKSIP